LNNSDSSSATAIVIGASGQDGYFLTERLLGENWTVHATARGPESLGRLSESEKAGDRLQIHAIDIERPRELFDLIAETRPEEIYNLAGKSSVSMSFADPLLAWRTNANFVALLLECIRCESPLSRLYQASSTDMFGAGTDGALLCDEGSVLNPQSPYASAKAAAHLLCRSYRQDYNLRIACGIVSNHESHRRPANFLTRKIADHVGRLRRLNSSERASLPPLRMGNLNIRRDWGFAPDYVDGMRLILRQIGIRNARSSAATDKTEPGPLIDEGRAYKDYVLGTGCTYSVKDLVDTAFRLVELDLDWDLNGDDPNQWRAYFRSSGLLAVETDPALLRPADPLIIQVDPSRARRELGWSPRIGLEVFLADMLSEPVAANAK
jgi:GDPmannose 4,6-dehydratase